MGQVFLSFRFLFLTISSVSHTHTHFNKGQEYDFHIFMGKTFMIFVAMPLFDWSKKYGVTKSRKNADDA